MDAPILRFDRHIRPKGKASLAESAVCVEITKGRVRQRLRQVRGPAFLVGTAQDCDLVVGDLTFPEAYAYLLVQDEKVTIRRVGEGPELLVNGETIEAADLFDGDQLAFGPFELRMVINERRQPVVAESSAASVGSWLLSGELAEV